jgi:hypothetical protein
VVEAGIYVKLPTGIWVRITGKMERIVKSRRKERQAISYTLVGESLDGKPGVKGRASTVFYISSSSATKYIIKILDYKIDKPVIIEPVSIEVYKVRVYDRDLGVKLRKIAEEMKIIRIPKKKHEEA